jgi:hypothetical protein
VDSQAASAPYAIQSVQPNLSNVRSALAFATASRPDLGRERASRRSSATVAGSRSLPPLLSRVIGVVSRCCSSYSDPSGDVHSRC